MLKLFKKNKKGRFLIYGSAIIIIAAIITLLIVVNNVENPAEKTFGLSQKQTINRMNQKDSILLYENLAADRAQKDITHSTLATNAGFYREIDSSDPNADITGCGTYVYPSLTDGNGKDCTQNFEYEKQYLSLFRENFLKYTARISELRQNDFQPITIQNNFIYPVAPDPVYLLITSEDISVNLLPPSSILDPSIVESNYADDVAEAIKQVNVNDPYFNGLTTGLCSAFVKSLLWYVYRNTNSFPGIQCFPGDAWDVAACYLIDAENNPTDSRVVYAGPNINYDEIKSEPDLLKPGDILFSASKTTWCKWTGYNAYPTRQNRCNYGGGTNDETKYLRLDTNGNPVDTGFCRPNSFDDTTYPLFCYFDEDGRTYEEYPVITHIFIYLGEDANGQDIIGNLYASKRVDENLEQFISIPKYEGIRMIVRPDYPRI